MKSTLNSVKSSRRKDFHLFSNFSESLIKFNKVSTLPLARGRHRPLDFANPLRNLSAELNVNNQLNRKKSFQSTYQTRRSGSDDARVPTDRLQVRSTTFLLPIGEFWSDPSIKSYRSMPESHTHSLRRTDQLTAGETETTAEKHCRSILLNIYWTDCRCALTLIDYRVVV